MITYIELKLNKLKDEVSYLENQSRRNNIRVDGIPEQPGENWKTIELKVKDLLSNKLDQKDEIQIERPIALGGHIAKMEAPPCRDPGP